MSVKSILKDDFREIFRESVNDVVESKMGDDEYIYECFSSLGDMGEVLTESRKMRDDVPSTALVMSRDDEVYIIAKQGNVYDCVHFIGKEHTRLPMKSESEFQALKRQLLADGFMVVRNESQLKRVIRGVAKGAVSFIRQHGLKVLAAGIIIALVVLVIGPRFAPMLVSMAARMGISGMTIGSMGNSGIEIEPEDRELEGPWITREEQDGWMTDRAKEALSKEIAALHAERDEILQMQTHAMNPTVGEDRLAAIDAELEDVASRAAETDDVVTALPSRTDLPQMERDFDAIVAGTRATVDAEIYTLAKQIGELQTLAANSPNPESFESAIQALRDEIGAKQDGYEDRAYANVQRAYGREIAAGRNFRRVTGL